MKQESGTKTFTLCKVFQATTQAVGFLRVPPRFPFKRLVLSTTLWQHAKMSTILKSLKGLKDLECKKGQLDSQPPILYVPPMDLVTNKEAPDSLKIKLPDGTFFNVSICSHGNTKEYLAHVVAVLCLINRKGLNVQCRKLAKAVDKLAETLENLQNTVGTKGATPKDELESRKLEIRQTQEMLEDAPNAHNSQRGYCQYIQASEEPPVQ
jgi:hypothetical protein